MINLLCVLGFLFLVPYIQIFALSRIFVFGSIYYSPSLFIATLILFSAKMPFTHTYTYAFLLGVISSIIYGLPAGINAVSYLLIVMVMSKFASNFDLTGFVGQFILGFAALMFNWFYVFILSMFLNISSPSFFSAILSSFMTGILLVFLFSVFFTRRKSIV